MRQNIIIVFTAILILSALMSSCVGKTADELYKLPQLSAEFKQLQRMIDAALESGLEYSPPQQGKNTAAVQLRDIDGDGTEEAFAFFFSGEYDLNVYYYRRIDDTYIVADILQIAGQTFDEVEYVDMNGDDIWGIAIGARLGTEKKRVTFYKLSNENHNKLEKYSESDYLSICFGDITGDGYDDMICVKNNQKDTTLECMATWLVSDAYLVSKTSELSSIAKMPKKMTVGILNDGITCVFTDSETTDGGLVTDIFCVSKDELINIVKTDGVPATYRSADAPYTTERLHGEDIMARVPEEIVTPENNISAGACYDWYSYSSNGEKTYEATTYYYSDGGWCLDIDRTWIAGLTVIIEDNPYVYGERTISFSCAENDSEKPFLIIYMLTGDRREDRSQLSGRFILNNDGTNIIAAELNGDMSDEESIHKAFEIINPQR